MEYLKNENIEFKDYGTYSTESVDYPVYANAVASAICDGTCDRGILLCSTGIGISITANRYKGIRAALCHDVFSAKATRAHNDANILVMGGKVIGVGLALEILKAFLATEFSGEERHCSRIAQIEKNV